VDVTVKQNMKHFKTTIMNNTLHISASFDQPQLLENMIEKLAYRRYDIGFSKQNVPKGWRANDTSTIETYVSGTIELDQKKSGKIKIPFISSFLFTCTSNKNESYQLKWSLSLS
jgi:hypothetical protein